MKVVPSDNDAVYYYDVLSKQILDQHHSGDLAVYMHSRGWIRIPITWLLLRGSMLRAK